MSTFLCVVEKKVFDVLCDLVSPDNPKDKTLVVLVAVMKQHYKPVTFVIAERFTFHRRCQQLEETVSEFAAELRTSNMNCSFNENLPIL